MIIDSLSLLIKAIDKSVTKTPGLLEHTIPRKTRNVVANENRRLLSHKDTEGCKYNIPKDAAIVHLLARKMCYNVWDGINNVPLHTINCCRNYFENATLWRRTLYVQDPLK